jgi:hypothetical protein|tara:strand:+ start:1860 stop:2066 length:207 start_codon:yes stop_codon:yes gene_type:complete
MLRCRSWNGVKDKSSISLSLRILKVTIAKEAMKAGAIPLILKVIFQVIQSQARQVEVRLSPVRKATIK